MWKKKGQVCKLDQLVIKHALKKAEPGIKKYLNIMNLINKVNVSQSEEFQKAFNGFYRMRQRPPIYYEKFYFFMAENKENSPSFEKTLRFIHEELGRVEASFSSKLVATINPDLPIWDTVVLKNLDLKAPAYYRKHRIAETISLYEEIKGWYKNYLETEEGKLLIELFDGQYPNIGITNIKKVDFVLWQIRE
jgi:hypothetical protein